MKRKLDLRTGRPVWFAYRSPSVPVDRLVRDVKADVLVVGMGISGAMIAEELSGRGLSVIVVDRRGPLKGSTPATTALVQYEIDQPLGLLSAKVGKEIAQRAWRRSRLAVMNLKARIDELEIACALSPKQSLYLAGNVLDAGGLREETAARREAGLYATYLTRGELREQFGFDRAAAIVSRDNLALDPRKLAAGLLLKAVDRGARLYAPVEVTGIVNDGDGVVAATRDGPSIRAGHAVLATGYELTDMAPDTDHSIISTWAIATAPQKRALWPGEAFVWEASDPYLYLRATADGRVICGGEDEDFTDEERRDSLIGEKTKRLQEKLAALVPGIDPTATHAWAGSFGSTATGLPLIGKIPRRPRLMAVMGYGGNGITYSRIAAELVATTLTGGKDRDADLFALDR
jgi:glycine/D-amino acid oxidase-like deaminating enzyme